MGFTLILATQSSLSWRHEIGELSHFLPASITMSRSSGCCHLRSLLAAWHQNSVNGLLMKNHNSNVVQVSFGLDCSGKLCQLQLEVWRFSTVHALSPCTVVISKAHLFRLLILSVWIQEKMEGDKEMGGVTEWLYRQISRCSVSGL